MRRTARLATTASALPLILAAVLTLGPAAAASLHLVAAEGYAFSFAFAINDEGVVAAHVTTASGDVERVARWTPGIGWELLGGVGELNVAWGINNNGTIVGEGRPSPGLERAFIYLEGVGMLSLTEHPKHDYALPWTEPDAVAPFPTSWGDVAERHREEAP